MQTTEIREITITSPAEWAEFVDINPDTIDDAGGDVEALRIASNGGLECGGGAMPLTVVYFVDDVIQARLDAMVA